MLGDIRSALRLAAGLVLLGAVIGGACALTCSVWSECRDAGYSRLYCYRMVSR